MPSVSSCLQSACSFFGGIKDKTVRNYTDNAQILDLPSKYIAKSIGSVVWSVTLNGVGTVIDNHWQPAEGFPPLFATIGIGLGLFSSLGETLTKIAIVPVNGVVSVAGAMAEQIDDTVSAWLPTFATIKEYLQNIVFLKYDDARGSTHEMQPNPSQITSALVGGTVGMAVAGNFFTQAANFIVPFGKFIGLSPAMLAAPLASTAAVAVAKPATKVAVFAIALAATPVASCYRFLKSKETAPSSSEDLGELLLNGRRPTRPQLSSA